MAPDQVSPAVAPVRSQVEPPRIFFLGAGFSRAAGLPLASELLASALAEVHRDSGGRTKLDKSLDQYLRFVEATTGERPEAIDIEQFISFLDHEHVLGLRGSDTWNDQGNEDQLMLRWAIGAAIHRATPSAVDLPPVYLNFAKGLRPRDQIVTFNYDLLMETALSKAGVPFRRFPTRYSACQPGNPDVDSEAEATEVLLLKVHGSIDWTDRSFFDADARASEAQGTQSYRDRNLIFGPRPVTPSHRLVEGPRPDPDPLGSIVVLEDLDAYYANVNHWHHAAPLILAPSHAKLLYGPGLRDFWRGLPRMAWAWGGLSIIGYSLPAADTYARQALYELAAGYVLRLDEPGGYASGGVSRRIKLVDHQATRAGADSLRRAYRFLDDRHCDFILDGWNDAACAEVLR